MSSYELIDSDTINHEIKQPPPRPREAWPSSDTARSRLPDRRSRDEGQFVDEDFNPEQRRYPPSEMMPDKEMFQSMLERFRLAIHRNEELQNEINKMREISTTKIDETAKAVKELRWKHKKELEKERKISSEATKQFEDAKIVVLSYKSKNIEVEATVRSLREEIATHKETISNLENRISHLMQGAPIGGRPQQLSMQGDTREVERLRKDHSILKEELRNYKMALELKDQDFEELREKRDAYKEDFTRVAMERDALRKDSSEMKRRYDDLVEENAKNKKELSALRQRLQQIHIENNTLQRNLQDTKQQLDSLDVSAKISQKDRESVSQEVQKQYEEDWMKLKQESSEWRAKYNEVVGKLDDAKKHSEDEQIYLRGVIDSLKDQLERKDKEWLNLESGPTERDDELLRQVDHLQQEKSTLLEDINALKSQLKQKEKECMKALESEDDLMREKEDLQRKLDRKTREISRVTEENERLERKLEDLRKNKEDVLSPTESGPKRPRELRLLNRMEEMSKENNALKCENDNLKREKDKLKEESEQLKQGNEELEASQRARVENLEDTMKELHGDLRMKDEEIQQIQRENRDYFDDLEKWKQDYDAQRRDIDELRTQLKLASDKHEWEHENNRENLVALQQTNATLENRVKQCKSELHQYADNMREVCSQLNHVKEDKVRLQSENKQLTKRVDSLLADAKRKEDDHELLKLQVKQFKSDFEAERSGHVQTAKDRDGFKKRCEHLSEELKHLQSSQHHTQTPVNLSYMYKSEEDDQRRGTRQNQPSYTDYPRDAFGGVKHSTSAIGRAGGIPPPGGRGGVVPHPGDKINDFGLGNRAGGIPPPGHRTTSPVPTPSTKGDDSTQRRHPCPICGRTFPDLQKLERHASGCVGT